VRQDITTCFVDILEDTKNLDESLIEAAACDMTRVIVPVHCAGVACEMDAIVKFAERDACDSSLCAAT